MTMTQLRFTEKIPEFSEKTLQQRYIFYRLSDDEKQHYDIFIPAQIDEYNKSDNIIHITSAETYEPQFVFHCIENYYYGRNDTLENCTRIVIEKLSQYMQFLTDRRHILLSGSLGKYQDIYYSRGDVTDDIKSRRISCLPYYYNFISTKIGDTDYYLLENIPVNITETLYFLRLRVHSDCLD